VPTSLPERSLHIVDVAAPFRRKPSALDITMEAAVRPIAYARDVSIFTGLK
jgi:hypothetical protein